jgi:hypothetical protein
LIPDPSRLLEAAGITTPELLALTATRPMYELLCALDERSFLAKPFWKQLRQARGRAS